MGADEIELRLAWERAVGRSRAGRALLERLLDRHRQPHRRYHGVRHVVWVVRHVHELAADEPVADLDAVVVAACYHDAVYVGRPGADEQASADLARDELTDLATVTGQGATGADGGDPAVHAWPAERIERVAQLVLATAHLAEPSTARPDPGTSDATVVMDAPVLVDADLAVLAAPPAAYLDYARGVRAEHPDLDEPRWREGRAAALRTLLARPTIYATPTGRSRWEARARANLTAELAGLEPPE